MVLLLHKTMRLVMTIVVHPERTMAGTIGEDQGAKTVEDQGQMKVHRVMRPLVLNPAGMSEKSLILMLKLISHVDIPLQRLVMMEEALETMDMLPSTDRAMRLQASHGVKNGMCILSIMY
jgi:hypothetical protein